MKEQSKSAILPPLPIVGKLKITTKDGKSLSMIEVVDSGTSKELDPFFEYCFHEFQNFLRGQSKKIAIRLDFTELTSFHKEVLKAMKDIPYGKVASYKDLALKMNSRAYQAIGSACGRNPFMLIYPCHRVVGSNGLGGFAHGEAMKKKLLKLEGATLP